VLISASAWYQNISPSLFTIKTYLHCPAKSFGKSLGVKGGINLVASELVF
tara:strand:- start:57 stop:206 length:150 start_codon:yes stop_codon:yes gene_type:complete